MVGGVILAHQGGWDEMLLVAGPIVLFYGVLRLANRRAKALPDKTASEPGDIGSDG